jgi:hypothetical protein
VLTSKGPLSVWQRRTFRVEVSFVPGKGLSDPVVTLVGS